MKKTRLALAAPVLAVALAACGGSGTTAATSAANTSTTTSSSASGTTSGSAASTTSTDDSTSSTTSDTSTQTSTETATGPVATPTSTSTSTSAGWVTTEHRFRPRTAAGTVADGWTTTNSGAEQFCQPAGSADLSASPYAKGPGVFSCGPLAASLLACWTFTDGKVGCMQNANRRLVMFRSTLRFTGAPTANPTPIKVVLADGTVCSPMAHDQAQHYQGRSGFLGCGKDSELLTAQNGRYGYFDTSAAQWTADSVPYDGIVKPKTVQVKEIWFAQGA